MRRKIDMAYSQHQFMVVMRVGGWGLTRTQRSSKQFIEKLTNCHYRQPVYVEIIDVD